MSEPTKLEETFRILVDGIGLGFDAVITTAVPAWFIDELAAAWRHCEPMLCPPDDAEIREALLLEGWREVGVPGMDDPIPAVEPDLDSRDEYEEEDAPLLQEDRR